VRAAQLACASHGLPSSRVAPHAAPLSRAAWRGFTMSIVDQRLTGLAARAIADEAFPVSSEQRAEMEVLETDAAALCLRLDAVLLEVSALLAPFAEHRALKGAATAHLAYPDPALRCYGDVDILVRSDHFDAALAALVQRSARPHFDEPRPGFTHRFSKGVAVDWVGGFEVDLHRTLAAGPLGQSVHLADLFEPADTFELGGAHLLALPREVRFLHGCYHAVLGSSRPRLVPLRDVAQMGLDPRLDDVEVLRLAGSWRASAVVARAVSLAWETLQIDQPTTLSEWAATYRPTAPERRALRCYTSTEERYARQALAMVGSIKGVRGKISYIHALALPSRSYVAERDGTYLRRWRRAAQLLRRAGSDR
jgi:hypothetical protein